MYNSDFVQENILYPQHKYPLSYLLGEIVELIEAIENDDEENKTEEISDVVYAAQMIFAQTFGINVKMFEVTHLAIEKFHARIAAWHEIFAMKGVEFSPAFLKGGGNFDKPAKIVLAFKAAGVEVSLRDANIFINEFYMRKTDKKLAAMGVQLVDLRPLNLRN